MADQDVQDAIAEIWQLFRETTTQFKETDARLDQYIREADARLDQRFRETDEKLRRLEALFGDQWGRLLEALVHPSAIQLFREWGIQVDYIFPRAKRQLNGQSMEIDLILENGDDVDVIVVEVKSTIKVADVNDFLEDLAQFPVFFPRYARYHIYAAVAGLGFVEEADRYAYRRGLFVLGMGKEGLVEIRNDDGFHPKDFGSTAADAASDSVEPGDG